MGKAPCCDKTKVRRGPWSPEEDKLLMNYVQKHGTGGNWITLPQKAGLRRCGKSCRLRWMNYLRPDIKHGGYTEEEEHIISTLYKTIGSKWSIIASHLTGRTDNDVKNYWNTKLKKKMIRTMEEEGEASQTPTDPAIDSTDYQSKTFISELHIDLNEVSSKSSDDQEISSNINIPDWFAYESVEMNAFLWDFGFVTSPDESMQEIGGDSGGDSSVASFGSLWSFPETMAQSGDTDELFI